MQKNNIQAIVLAAGKSTRLKTGRNKLIEKICGQPMIAYVTKLLTTLDIPTTVVIGHQKELIKKCINKYHHEQITFVIQEDQQGTAHAINCTRELWNKEHILIMNGDMPLVTPEIIQALYKKHIDSDATLSFVMAHHTDPTTSYGRVMKTDNKIKIVEAKEFTGDSSDHCCINAGIYLVKKSFIKEHLNAIEQNEVSQEFHITDLISRASDHDKMIATVSAPFDYVRGINNQHELWAAEQIQRSNIIKHWMEHGVRFSVAHNVHIDLDVVIGPGTYIGCGVHLLYGTKIGSHCRVHEYAALENATVGDDTHIYPFSIIKNSTVGRHAHIGPFAHIREQSVIADNATIGNFVEIKNSRIDNNSKAKHLSYIGDAEIGKQVNIGAGTITCNYDGQKKHKTIIKDNVFVGSNNTLIAPVTIHEGAFTAGGSTITQDVPAQALAIARIDQINKPDYAKKLTALDQPDEDEESTVCHLKQKEPPKKAEYVGATRTTNDTLTEPDSR